MCLLKFITKGLYIALYIRSDPPTPDDFHWALYYQHYTTTGGMKYHIKGRTGAWIAEYNTAVGILGEFLLVGLFQFGSVPEGIADALGLVDRQLRKYDEVLDTTGGITCRTWVWMVLEGLEGGIVKCENSRELEKEVLRWGNEHAESAAKNVKPRPVGRREFV